MTDEPELHFKIDKKRVSVASSFRALITISFMSLMAFAAFMTWMVYDCRSNVDCVSSQGDRSE